MVTKVKKGMPRKKIDSLMKRHENSNKSSLDLEKYCGALKLKVDPLDQQKELRNEWK